MLRQLQADYQRLEQSLQRLTDSISTYKPSTSAAEELAAADEAITQSVDTLAQHQINHARIQQLRQASASLDATLKNTIQVLAETRREIKAIPSYTSTESSRPLQIDQLLAYAKFISRTSLPSSRRVVPTIPITEDSKVDSKPTTNGNTPAPTMTNGDAADHGESIGVKSLDDGAKRLLDPMRDLPFEPWPAYAVIQQGALASIQKIIDAGQDPAAVLSAAEQAEADRIRSEQEEREKQEQEERERRRMSMYHGSRSTAQDDVFDPDEA